MPKKESSGKKPSQPKLKLLLNANLSRIIASYLKQKGYNCIHLSEIASVSMSDNKIVNLAKQEQRIVVTHDLDYGEIYYLKEQGKIGVIILRIRDQTTKSTIEKITKFLSSAYPNQYNLSKSLTIISDNKIRIFSP